METCSILLSSNLLFLNGFGNFGIGFALFLALFYLFILAVIVFVLLKFLQIAKDVKAIRTILEKDRKENSERA